MNLQAERCAPKYCIDPITLTCTNMNIINNNLAR